MLALGLVLFAAPASPQVGSVLRSLKINKQSSGLSELVLGDFFGCALARLGDLNGDGVVDLAVGASGRCSILILFLRTDGGVQAHTEVVPGGSPCLFGRRLAIVGDLDGDGISELATTHPNGVAILFLRPDGTLRRLALTPFSDPLFVPPTQASFFIGGVFVGGLCGLGDIDGDGIGDLAVGSPGDPDGGFSAFEKGAFWVLRLKADGTLKAAQKVSQTQGGFGGALGSNDRFGHSLALLGDIDSNGSPEIGVGSFNGASDRRFWVISLAPSGTVLGRSALGLVDYGLFLSIGTQEYAAIGDLDGDGLSEVAMGLPLLQLPGGLTRSGGFAVGFLKADGSVKKRLAVGHDHGGFGALPQSCRFGESFAPLGDLDGDGAMEVAVGAPQDRAGAVWILSLDPSAVRNGSGVNPLILSQSADPVIGATWSATLDCSGQASGLAAVLGFSAPTSGVFAPYGEVLVTGQRVFYLLRPHSGGPTPFQENVPNRLDLFGLPIFIQGVCTGAPGTRVSNALDVVVGK